MIRRVLLVFVLMVAIFMCGACATSGHRSGDICYQGGSLVLCEDLSWYDHEGHRISYPEWRQMRMQDLKAGQFFNR